MNKLRFFALTVAIAAPVAAHAQFVSLGLAAGTSISSGEGNGSGMHGNVSLEVKAPLLPGLRGEAWFIDVKPEGKVAATASVVLSAPIPVVTPYLIGGWGSYGLGGDESKTGFNVGVGAKASVVVGPAIYVEVRRHDPIALNLVTVGVRF
jgi:hypothetical protein